ncbi:MAG: helix-turn-helix transcriptional regulator [Trueperaceae bacterium]|nr:MAG: helix-turn-helix transcriptional regulator [Trueperaceae bacterium]
MATREQARLLTDPASVRFFKPFLAVERSQKEAAAELGCTLATLHYRVKTFLAAGLLEVSSVKKRAGRPIKRYRSVAPEVFVPFSLTPYADLEESLRDQLAPVWTALVSGLASAYWQAGSYGRKMFRDQRGVVWTSPATGAEGSNGPEDLQAFYTDIGLPLSEHDYRHFMGRLAELYLEICEHAVRASEARAGRERTYLFQVGLVPW